MTLRTLDHCDVTGKTVLCRVDLNVPIQDGTITDTTRMEAILPTIMELRQKGAKIVLMAHLGRPKGEVKPELSLAPVAEAFSDMIGQPVEFVVDCFGEAPRQVIRALQPGQICLLENLRFHPGEEKNDPDFTAELAVLGDIFVNDAFSAAHRAHASTEGVTHMLPSFAGRLMEAEIKALTEGLEAPEKPVAAVVGGAKISTKLDVLNNIVKKVDILILGGGMANTFLYAQGVDVGASLCETDMIEQAKAVMTNAQAFNCELILPLDVVTGKEFKVGTPTQTKPVGVIQADDMALDIGPETIALIKQKLEDVKTVLWNGPLGAFEIKPFDTATNTVARFVADSGAQSIAGGGDTVAALDNAGVKDQFSYISTAGGAFLEWLEGKNLPGVAALQISGCCGDNSGCGCEDAA